MKFLMQLLLSFLVGLAIGNVLMSVWYVMGALDSFNARFERW
jgi:hypothetical protein